MKRQPAHRAAPWTQVLANGLRVVIDTVPAEPLTAVAVHYRVGFRSEPEGRSGLAHLVEHMMFEGSEHHPRRSYFAELLAAGGSATGSTHQDYTDYVHMVPADLLEDALAAEADRMRAPLFTADGLDAQLTGVASEIAEAVNDTPLGALPWQLLPAVMYTRWANAHDGYGTFPALADVTPSDCAAFFHDHYAPGNAVVTVSGGGEPERVAGLVSRYFGTIPARAVPARPPLAEPPLSADRVVVRPTRGSGALTLGYRLPDPSTDLDGYLAHMILARLLTTARRRAGCGFFRPLDAVDPDTLLVTVPVDTPSAQGRDTLEDALTGVDTALLRIAEGARGQAGQGLVRTTAAGLATEHLRAHHGPATRASALGRWELLFGAAGLVNDLPARIREVRGQAARAAAEGLLSSHRAVLAVIPATTRCAHPEAVRFRAFLRSGPGPDRHGASARPITAVHPAQDAEHSLLPATDPTRTSVADTAPGSVRVPGRTQGNRSLRSPGSLRLAGLVEAGGPEGPRVVAVRDGRAPVVELRLRLVTPAGSAPADQEGLCRIVSDRWDLLWGESGPPGERAVRVETGAVLLDAWLPAAAADPVLFTELLAAPPTAAEWARVGPRVRARLTAHSADTWWLADQAVRRWLAPAPRTSIGTAPALADALLTAVGDLDPESWAASAEAALRAALSRPSSQGVAVASAAERLAHIRLPAGRPAPAAHVVWATPEPRDAGPRAARWLAVAVLGGGQPGARLAGLRTPGAPFGFTAYAGRFPGPSGPLVQVGAQLLPDDAVMGASLVRDAIRRAGEEPPGGTEVDAARRYCSGQLILVRATQSGLADQLAAWTAVGHPATELEGFPDALHDVATTEVARACAALFAQPAYTGALAGAAADPAEDSP